MVETYYDVLGVDRDASSAAIEDAYRELVLDVHPDRNDDPNAPAQFTRITTARDVLIDETERARYDRLGHDSYVRYLDGAEPTGPESNPTTESEARTSDRAGESESGHRSARSSPREAAREYVRDRRRTRRTGPSHHARHRAKRRRATEGRFGDDHRGTDATAGERASVENRTGFDGGRSRTTTTPDPNAATNPDPNATTNTGRSTGNTFEYSVHGWNDAVDVGNDRPPVGQSTVITAGCIGLFYPLFVYASITPTFQPAVNGAVALCTLLLVGYLLTLPRFAIATFGGWGLLSPLVLEFGPFADPTTPIGVAVLATFWVPFGYAVSVWWVLRR